ncbi:MAG: hypothetical protein N2Z21_07250 [Candidatus Sumerlaeaceae bacterium]|nr:hypothetical protein [Candidatus Sumerlaeaceae bacterium]
MMRLSRLLSVCLAFAFATISWAQQAQDELGLSGLYATYRKTVFWVAGGLLVIVVGGFIMRRAQQRAQRGARERRLPFAFDDLSKLEQRGMLTKEEAAKVRDALIRQATQRHLSSANPLQLKGEDALLHDEEVKRLEALAAIKRMAKETDVRTALNGAHDGEEIPEELRPAVEKGLLSVEEARAIARRQHKKT